MNKLVCFYDGVDGIKTGYTNEAGYCLTVIAQKEQMRLIAVVFGEADASVRNHEISKMLDYGFNVYETEKLLPYNRIVGKIKVIKGKQKEVKIVPLHDLSLLYKKGEKRKNVTYEVKIDTYQAPLKKGVAIGRIKLKEDDKIIGEVEVTVAKDILKANILVLYGRYLSDIIKGDINLKLNKYQLIIIGILFIYLYVNIL